MVRMSISNILAEDLRTYEITNNGGLGLPHDQLVNYIRILERRSSFKGNNINYINKQQHFNGRWPRHQQQSTTTKN